MLAISAQKRRYGYRRMHILLQRDDCFASPKRIWRLYSKGCTEGPQAYAAVERTPLSRAACSKHHYHSHQGKHPESVDLPDRCSLCQPSFDAHERQASQSDGSTIEQQSRHIRS